MSGYPDFKTDNVELLKIKTRDDEIKNLKYTHERHDHENFLKSLKVGNDYYKQKYKSLNKKKILLIITEILVGSASAVGSSTMGLINPGAGIFISSSTALLTSIAILITNEYISKLKIRSTKLRDWINVITLLYEKTFNLVKKCCSCGIISLKSNFHRDRTKKDGYRPHFKICCKMYYHE